MYLFCFYIFREKFLLFYQKLEQNFLKLTNIVEKITMFVIVLD